MNDRAQDLARIEEHLIWLEGYVEQFPKLMILIKRLLHEHAIRNEDDLIARLEKMVALNG